MAIKYKCKKCKKITVSSDLLHPECSTPKCKGEIEVAHDYECPKCGQIYELPASRSGKICLRGKCARAALKRIAAPLQLAQPMEAKHVPSFLDVGQDEDLEAAAMLKENKAAAQAFKAYNEAMQAARKRLEAKDAKKKAQLAKKKPKETLIKKKKPSGPLNFAKKPSKIDEAKREKELAKRWIAKSDKKEPEEIAAQLQVVQTIIHEAVLINKAALNEALEEAIKRKWDVWDEEQMPTMDDIEEILATANAIYANVQKGADPFAFLTTSDWASSVGVVLAFISITNLVMMRKKFLTQKWENLESLAVATQRLATGVQGSANFCNWVGIGAEGATALTGTVGGLVASGLGVVVGTVTVVKESKTIAKLSTIGERYDQVCEDYPEFDKRMLEAIQAHSKGKKSNKVLPGGLDWMLYKITLKVRRRKFMAGYKASAAVWGIGASGYATGVSIAIAAGVTVGVAVPIIGWVALGVCTAGALGALGYKATKRQLKKKKLKELRQAAGKKIWIPSFVQTTGEFNRFRVALFLHSAACAADLGRKQFSYAELWIQVLFGGSKADAIKMAQELGVAGIMGYIKG